MKPCLHTGKHTYRTYLAPLHIYQLKKRNNLFKISHDVRKKEDKTLKYFQSCFWELYSQNTDCNVQRLSHQSKKDFCISVHDAPPDDKGIKR